MKVSLLDYGAGNVRSVRNAILATPGVELEDIVSPEQIDSAAVIVFPGVGAFGTAMRILQEKGYVEPLQNYLRAGRPYLGICLGMQTLFESSAEGSDEDGNDEPLRGLGVIPGRVQKFDSSQSSVPHIGWNGRVRHQDSPVLRDAHDDDDDNNATQTYFVHSYYAPVTPDNQDWVLTTTTYGPTTFISAVQKGNIVATQFHPEKSGQTGLQIIRAFLDSVRDDTLVRDTKSLPNSVSSGDSTATTITTTLVKRVVVALDVRSNDDGDLVVTKGDQYDVREKTSTKNVRNLGRPVALAQRYYDEGADEICFLNITSFRQGVLEDAPMLRVLEEASRQIFVPLTVGGGIRSYTDPDSGKEYSALKVAARYFRAGADKVSIGSDAVYAAEAYVASGGIKTGTTSIEQISKVYGVQAVVVSIDPKRVWLTPDETTSPSPPSQHHVITATLPDGTTRQCWYQSTVKGGRETRDMCAVTLARACEALGAGELMVNCIDMDGQGQGYAHDLLQAIRSNVNIPIIASSGAGTAQHFVDAFQRTPNLEAALAAGMFHRKEVEIEDVKKTLMSQGIAARLS